MKGCGSQFGNWLAGLIAGEACFRIHKVQGGKQYPCAFRIKLRYDDLPILREIKRRTGFGRINVFFKTKKKSHRPQAAWIVESKAACLQLVKLLDRFPLRAKKRHDYSIWRKAVLYQSFKRQRGDWSQMIAYKKQIQKAQFYRGRESER